MFADAGVHLALDYQREVAWPELPADAEARLGAVIRATIARAGLRGVFAVSLIITGDRQIQRVNRRYRGIDKATDVLSFPQSPAPLLPLPPDIAWAEHPFGDDTHAAWRPAPPDDRNGQQGDHQGSRSRPAVAGAGMVFVLPDAQPEQLGDIMIAAPTVARQAAAAGHGAWWELCFLVAHGTLHLLGYDDYYAPGYQAMVALQVAVLADLTIPRAGE